VQQFNHQDVLSEYTEPVFIKTGGQKIVYKIRYQEFRWAILKIGKFNSKTNLERIQREVIVQKEIDSKYYPRNYDFKIINGNRFVIVEEYIEGEL